MKRTFLFLQGPIGPFFKRFGERLKQEGHSVIKINFNSGDRFFWDGEETIDFTRNISQWGNYIRHVARLRKVTDIILYGDCRPVHKEAIESLAETDIKIHVLEEGYFRPSWVTIEQDGVNANSRQIPQDANFYREWQEKKLPETRRFGSSFNQLAIYTVQYYLAAIKGMYGEFRSYHHHFDISPHVTMAMWIPRTIFSLWNKYKAGELQEKIVKKKFFLVPMQLSRDYQIKKHSSFGDTCNFAEHLIKSFAENADSEDSLVFKAHPLDNNSMKVESRIANAAARYGVEERVIFIDGGHLPTMLDNAKGVIIVNSTTGLSAIHHNRPTLALGRAIYNFEGMTDQKTLEEFWLNPQKPDMEVYAKFRNYVIYKTQVNGGFYNDKGIAAAINGVAARILYNKRTEAQEASN